MKLLKFPSLSMVNPTELPVFEIPFMLVPVPAFVPGVGPSKLVNVEPPALTWLMSVMVGPGTRASTCWFEVYHGVDLRGDGAGCASDGASRR